MRNYYSKLSLHLHELVFGEPHNQYQTQIEYQPIFNHEVIKSCKVTKNEYFVHDKELKMQTMPYAKDHLLRVLNS